MEIVPNNLILHECKNEGSNNNCYLLLCFISSNKELIILKLKHNLTGRSFSEELKITYNINNSLGESS